MQKLTILEQVDTAEAGTCEQICGHRRTCAHGANAL